MLSMHQKIFSTLWESQWKFWCDARTLSLKIWFIITLLGSKALTRSRLTFLPLGRELCNISHNLSWTYSNWRALRNERAGRAQPSPMILKMMVLRDKHCLDLLDYLSLLPTALVTATLLEKETSFWLWIECENSVSCTHKNNTAQSFDQSLT